MKTSVVYKIVFSLFILFIFINILSLQQLLGINTDRRIEGFLNTPRPHLRPHLRHLHRRMKTTTTELFTNTSDKLNRAIRKLGI
jgi:hypothetical protein